MKTYEVKTAVSLTVQPGSIVVLTDQQAAAVSGFVVEMSTEKKIKMSSSKKLIQEE